MRKRRKSSRGLGSVGTVAARIEELPGLIKAGKCASALNHLIYAYEDFAVLPNEVRFHAASLNNALTKLESIKERFRTSCIRQDGLSGARRR